MMSWMETIVKAFEVLDLGEVLKDSKGIVFSTLLLAVVMLTSFSRLLHYRIVCIMIKTHNLNL